MEDYIFLIIAVAISIFGALNKKRKDKMAQQPVEEISEEEEVKRRNYFMDQLLGEDFLDEEEAPPAPKVRVPSTPAKVVSKSSDEVRRGMNYQLPRFKSTLPDRPKHKSLVSTQRIKVEEPILLESEETTNYLEDFSLKKAVIYSALLEPKY